mgnify:FL=1
MVDILAEIKNITVQKDTKVRIDKFLAEEIEDITRSAVQKLIENGNVYVNEKIVSSNYKVKLGDQIKVTIPEPALIRAVPQDIPLEIAYEDDDLLVVNKQKGMVVHPAAGNYEGTLVNALLYYCKGSLSGINGEIRPGIVHRIDKDTSGLLIVAKNDFAHKNLAEQIKVHSFRREYEAVVYGGFKNDEGTINAPIGRSKFDRKKMAVTDKNSKPAITHYKVITRYKDFTHLKLRLETGRTHQIRVHMSYIGHPLAGDLVYAPKKPDLGLGGQCLHAKLIGFNHPRDGRYIEIESQLPYYFKNFLGKLKVD